MQLKKIGDYQYKGSVGIYVEAVDVPQEAPRYAALDWAFLPDEQFPAIRRGEVFESPYPDEVVSLFPRIEFCLGDSHEARAGRPAGKEHAMRTYTRTWASENDQLEVWTSDRRKKPCDPSRDTASTRVPAFCLSCMKRHPPRVPLFAFHCPACDTAGRSCEPPDEREPGELCRDCWLESPEPEDNDEP